MLRFRNFTEFAHFFIYENINRPMFEYIKTLDKKNLIGVEVGVSIGRNAERILKRLPIKKLYLVDPYEPYYEKGNLVSFHIHDFEKAEKRLLKFKNKTIFILKKSVDSIKDIPNNLDFVYLDGDHSYKGVKQELELYYKKLKKGGIIGGHDFRIEHLDVCKAVFEFALKYKLKIYGADFDWWMIK
jgi:predicted O-methyltransferase YrrM